MIHYSKPRCDSFSYRNEKASPICPGRILKHFILLICFISVTNTFNAQDISSNAGELGFRERFILPINQAEGEIKIDGEMMEADWLNASAADEFYRITPVDTGFADTKTEVYLTYDAKNLYLLTKCWDELPGDNIISSLKRDFSFGQNDNFLVFFDTYNDQTNGFSFGISAGGAQWDGLQADGGDVSLDWDCKWYSAIKHYDNYWIAEFAIPFRNFKYQKDVREWGINFSRMDVKRNEKSSWVPVPRQFRSSTLAFTGTLLWETAPPINKSNISLIPYVSADYSEDIELDEEAEINGNAGLDVKASLSPTLNLDLTLNPDFSQVDVDEQVTNLDRFELFFPEKRKFFLENEDLFSGYGQEDVRPFFSRRIGLENPVVAGVRLSGKLDENWRVGLLNMQTKTEDDIPAANFSVASVQRRVFSRSSIGAFFINKDVTVTKTDLEEGITPYNRVMGADFNLASSDNRWTGKTYLHWSLSPGDDKKAYSFSNTLSYSTQYLETGWIYDLVGSDFQAETGFVRRTGYHRLHPFFQYRFFPASEKIIKHGPDIQLQYFMDPDFEQTDRTIKLEYSVQFTDTRQLEISYENEYIKLLEPYDPTNYTGDTLDAGSEYEWSLIEMEYASDSRKLFNYELEASYGGYFHGDRFNLNGQLNYRIQPYGSFGVNISYDDLKFPEPYQDASFLLLGMKADITFSTKLFLTAFLQYNEQVDNFNTNIRFQWRYKPVSDLFIVYTDNHIPDGFNVKNRSLVIKLSYWFN